MVNYFIEFCDSPGYTSITESNLTLNVGQTISVILRGENAEICATVLGETNELPENIFYKIYQDCNECSQPLSGGSEYVGCYTCSGNTQTIQLPHPTWTNLSGKAVVILDAVELGGINGLNS